MRFPVTTLQIAAALATASVLEPRQGIDTSLVETAETPTSVSIPVGPTADSTSYNLSEATESATESPLPVGTEPNTRAEIVPRQTACQPLPTGAGPVPTPDTENAFLRFRAFATIARQAPTPSGYNETFVNLHARTETYGYLGFSVSNSYDTEGCADQCSTVFRGCLGFNIFFERDPTLFPSRGCRNPPATTTIKCVFWGGDVSTETTTNNTGEVLASFHVVIAGSNGYLRNIVPDVPGYDGEATGNSTIDAPQGDTNGDPGDGTFIGAKIFTTTFFDPALCAAACDAQTRHNLANPPRRGQPQICRFFTTYLLHRNGRIVGQYCALYTQYYPRRFATDTGATVGGDRLSITNAFSYRNRRPR
ncbi:hypothetical protein M426DRAFT_27908 [Hypoxylon sp. CI-4A]|nr:hypothetical protein M426DRAFT_27908 [Hypoxylon sp. CI-4A]